MQLKTLLEKRVFKYLLEASMGVEPISTALQAAV